LRGAHGYRLAHLSPDRCHGLGCRRRLADQRHLDRSRGSVARHHRARVAGHPNDRSQLRADVDDADRQPVRHVHLAGLRVHRRHGRRAEGGPWHVHLQEPQERRRPAQDRHAGHVHDLAVPAAPTRYATLGRMSTTGVSQPASAVLERYEAVIGVEVHCQLRTASKMFCSCSTAYDGARPNSHVCPVCLGLPGALPVINRRAVELVLATGAAIGAETPDATRWDRKNSFSRDLPKGYQISQYDLPLASAGALSFDTSDGPVTVRITRAHVEEVTAKLVLGAGPAGELVSLVDFNRAGVPLMEIGPEPD